MRQIIKGVAVAFVAAVALSGCGTAFKPANIEGQSKPVEIGYSGALFLDASNGREAGVWARVSKLDTKAEVTALSFSPLRPDSANEEVLLYLPKRRILMPALDPKGYNEGTHTFACFLVGSLPKTTYHPCGSGTRLVRSDAAVSAARSVVAGVVTLGLGVGIDYTVDNKAVQQLVDDTKMLMLTDEYLEYKRTVDQINADVAADDRRLIAGAELNVKVNNLTGFKQPVVPPNLVGLGYRRDPVLSVPPLVTISGGSPFPALIRDAQLKKDAALAEREFAVRCNPSIPGIPFDSTVTCPSKTKMLNGKLTSTAEVKLTAASFGRRYPNFTAANKKVEIRVQNGLLSINNLTDQYLEIKSVAVYAGADVQENAKEISIPPQAMTKEPIAISGLVSSKMDRLFTFERVTKSSLAGVVNKFGVAVKFRSGEGGNFETLLYSRQIDALSLLND